MDDTTPSLSSTGGQTYPFLTTSKFLIPLSLLALLPNLLSLTFHLRSRNIATSTILFWILTLNTLNLLNAILWHNDDLANWWHGKILCDIEVRLIVAGGFGGWTGATMALARSLSRVLDTERVRGGREWVIEALICWAPPCWFAVVVYAVQTLRYSIAAGYGCTPQVGGTWVTVILLLIWPVIFMLITCWYTGTFPSQKRI
jgi:pheromone a factor receptor